MGSLTDDLVASIASRLSSTRDLANLSSANAGLRRGAWPLLQRVRDLVRLARQVGFSARPMEDTDHVLALIGQLPIGQRFLPLRSLATQASLYLVLNHRGVHAQLTARIVRAASDLPPHEQDQLRALMHSPQSGMQMEMAGHPQENF